MAVRYIASAQWSLGDEAEVFTFDAEPGQQWDTAEVLLAAELGEDRKSATDMGDLVVLPLNEVPHLTPGD